MTLELERLKNELSSQKELLVAERASKQDALKQLDQERERRHDLVESGVRVVSFTNSKNSTGGAHSISRGSLDLGIREIHWTRRAHRTW